MSPPHTTFVIFAVLLITSGCISANGTSKGEYKTEVRTEYPMANSTVDVPQYGHNQPNSEVTTPTPLENKTPRKDVNVSLVEASLKEKLDSHRRLNNVQALVSDTRLARIARHHSYDMATREYVGHTNPDGVTFMNRLERSDYACGGGRENVQGLVWNPNEIETEEGLAEKILRGFMKSAPHNTAMINPEMTTVGIGIYVTEDPIVYVTMNLCDATPLPEEEEDQ